METIWGSSPKDVYVAGWSQSTDGRMYHYDGSNWRSVNIDPYITIRDIYGFAANNIWAVGEERVFNPNPPPEYMDKSAILHYDGWKWQKATLPPGGRMLKSIGGTSPTNLFAGGVNGTLFHYDGTHWQPDSIPFDIAWDAEPWHYINSITGSSSSGEIYLHYDAQEINNYLLKREREQWQVLYNMYNNGFSNLWLSPWGTLYGTGGDVQWWDGSQWNLLQENENRDFGSFFSKAIMGAADDNLFIVGHAGTEYLYGEVIHYNGEDWHEFTQFQFPDVQYEDVWTDGREVFIVGYRLDFPQITLVLHGK
jgi:hypothetical protein